MYNLRGPFRRRWRGIQTEELILFLFVALMFLIALSLKWAVRVALMLGGHI